MLVYCPYHIARSIRLGPEVDHRRGCCQISSLNVDVFITCIDRFLAIARSVIIYVAKECQRTTL